MLRASSVNGKKNWKKESKISFCPWEHFRNRLCETTNKDTSHASPSRGRQFILHTLHQEELACEVTHIKRAIFFKELKEQLNDKVSPNNSEHTSTFK